VRYARSFIVRGCPAELIFGDVLVGHGLDDVGTGDEMYEVLSTMRMKSVMAGE